MGPPDETAYLGTDYLAVCRAAMERDRDESAEAALQGISGVLEGTRAEFTIVYPCHLPKNQRWFIMRVSALQEPETGIVNAHNDITWRKQTEEDLKRSENKYNTLFNKTSIPMVLSQQPHYIIVDVNDAWIELFGYTRDEALGKNAIELVING